MNIHTGFKFLSLVTLFIFCSCSSPVIKRTDKLSIVQGITNSKEVEFSVVAKKGLNLKFELRDEENEILLPDEVKTISKDFSEFSVHKMVFVRDPLKDYNLYAFDGEKLIDQRLIGKGQRNPDKLSFAVASCMNDHYPEHFKIWDILAQKNPEYLLMIGDNVYADYISKSTTQEITPKALWNRYIDTRLSLNIFFQQKLIPIHAIWDDHDYGLNNGDKGFKYKDESLEIFETFFAQNLSDDDFTKGFGAGGLLSLGDFNLYFLDSRSFRDKTPEGSHLGLNQTAWLYSKLNEEKTPSLLIKGDQFFGNYHTYESFEGRHPKDFSGFVEELKKSSTPFLFISGDRHLSEIMQFPRTLFGKPSFEITSSPIHARTFPEEDRNPWRVVAEKEKVNFMLLQNEARDNHWFIDVQNIGEDGKIHFQRELSVFIKDLQNNLQEIRKRRFGKRKFRKMRLKRRKR